MQRLLFFITFRPVLWVPAWSESIYLFCVCEYVIIWSFYAVRALALRFYYTTRKPHQGRANESAEGGSYVRALSNTLKWRWVSVAKRRRSTRPRCATKMIIKNIKAAQDLRFCYRGTCATFALLSRHAVFIEYKVSRQRDRWREIRREMEFWHRPTHINMLKARSHQFPMHKVMRYPRIRATFLKWMVPFLGFASKGRCAVLLCGS